MRYHAAGAWLALLPALCAQKATFHEEKLHGRRAFVLENERMRVATLPGGGFLGEIRFKSGDPKLSVNPLRVPHYPTIDPFEYDAARDGGLYGTGMQRRLMSGYRGHYLCFPHFGPSSDAEFRNDYGQHGEALDVEWKLDGVDQNSGDVALRYSAQLPKTQDRVERSILLPGAETVGYVEESVENRTQYDRPMQWVQHVTLGPPFLEAGKSRVDASASRAAVGNGLELSEAAWPEFRGRGGQTTNLRVFSGNTGMWLMDASRPKGYFTMYNSGYGVLIGYIFETAPNRWVLDWQENQRMQEKPWNGKAAARAVCIGDSPFAVGLRQAVERGSAPGVPVYSWIQARQKRTQRYLFFLAEIASGFRGLAEARQEEGRIEIVERETNRTIAIRSGRRW
jgi:hypothetical protein